MQSLKDVLNNRTTLVIKRMGEIDRKAFREACLQKFPNGDLEYISAKLCSSWEEYLRDANWQPFKAATIKGNLQVCACTYCTSFTSFFALFENDYFIMYTILKRKAHLSVVKTILFCKEYDNGVLIDLLPLIQLLREVRSVIVRVMVNLSSFSTDI